MYNVFHFLKMDANFRVVQFTEIYHKAMNYTLLVLAVSVVHVILISNQIQHSSSSQGAATKVSLASIAMHTLVDAYGCLIHFTGGIVIDPLFHPLVWTAFTKFIVFSAYELRFIMMLWKARNPNITDWHRARRELSNLYSRFYAVVLLGLVFMYQFSEYLRLFVLVVYSFWLPQDSFYKCWSGVRLLPGTSWPCRVASDAACRSSMASHGVGTATLDAATVLRDLRKSVRQASR